MSEASTRKLIDELRTVLTDAEALVAATAGTVGEHAQSVRERAAQSVDRAQSGLDELESELAARAKALFDDAGGFVREHPWQSLGAAAAVGLVVGILLGRR
jgi:ElaB/YqjD/DUF883 family membrane-anchored ribosome-binding protein